MDHFGHVDGGLKSVESAQKVNRKGKSRQVSSGEERDHMCTVASLWFQKYRPEIVPYVSEAAVESIDEPLRRVWDATAKAAARTTYCKALGEARKALLQLRTEMPVLPSAVTVPQSGNVPPDFSPLATQPEMQTIMTRRWNECATCLDAGANLAAVVMMGGLIEALLVSKANHLPDRDMLAKATRAPKEHNSGKVIPYQKWTLNHYIEVGHELGWIGDIAKSVSGSLRDYRNFVHPQAELTRGHTIEAQDARLLWDVTKALARELLQSARR